MKAAGAVLNLVLAALFGLLSWKSREDGDWWWFLFALMAVGNVVVAVLKLRGRGGAGKGE